MKAYPPDDERFVKRQTSVKDWPVFSDYWRVIGGTDSQPLPTSRRKGADNGGSTNQ
jgi:hypothetical protein